MYYDRLTDLGIKLTKRGGQEKTLCPQCSNARKNKRDRCLSVNIGTGEYRCHNCGWKGNVRAFERRHDTKIYDKPDKNILANRELKEKVIDWFLKERKISESTLNKFLIFSKEEWMPQTNKKENCICFPYLRNSELVNVKFRDGRKNFKLIKDAELIFYNLNSISDKTKAIIVEGEIDCLSVYEAGYGKEYELIRDFVDEDTGEVIMKKHPMSEYGILSVPNGTSGSNNTAMEYLDSCADWFLGLDEIIIATDGDGAGISLKDELVRRLGVERCRTVVYPKDCVILDKQNNLRPCKDLNEVLVYFGKEKVIECIEQSTFVPVDGVYFVDDIYDSMISNFKSGVKIGDTTRFDTLDKYFRWKKGEINLFTGYANHGKTFFALQLMLTKSIYDGWKWAIFCPENYPANDFYDDLIEMYAGRWLQDMNENSYGDAAKFINDHIFYVYPDNEHDLVSIHEKFRYLILKKGCDGVLIDPWNQLDHNLRSYQREDQYLSEQFKDVKRFALLNHISYNIIAHPKTPTYNQDRSLPVADTYDLYGGSMWANKMDNILSYHRPLYHENKNSQECQLYVQKIKRKRTGGECGYIDLRLVWAKKRYAEIPGETMPCDPVVAEKKELKRQNDFVPQKMWLPYGEKDIEF